MSDFNPYWTPFSQQYAVDQQRMSHSQALYSFGEYAVFVMMWQLPDFEAGLVRRCPLCFDAFDKIAQAYGQSAQAKCPDCYGSTFEGGYKAILVRPALFDLTEDDVDSSRSGEINSAQASVQSTDDFAMNGGDYIFRADGTRWETTGPAVQGDRLRTGFEATTPAGQSVGFNYQDARKLSLNDVAFIIPPNPGSVQDILGQPNVGKPLDFSAVEEIRGPTL